jgi:hypothetical protein
VYYVEVTGMMIVLSREEIKKPSKMQPKQSVTTLEESMIMCKSKSSKQHETTPSHQSSEGIVQ